MNHFILVIKSWAGKIIHLSTQPTSYHMSIVRNGDKHNYTHFYMHFQALPLPDPRQTTSKITNSQHLQSTNSHHQWSSLKLTNSFWSNGIKIVWIALEHRTWQTVSKCNLLSLGEFTILWLNQDGHSCNNFQA